MRPKSKPPRPWTRSPPSASASASNLAPRADVVAHQPGLRAARGVAAAAPASVVDQDVHVAAQLVRGHVQLLHVDTLFDALELLQLVHVVRVELLELRELGFRQHVNINTKAATLIERLRVERDTQLGAIKQLNGPEEIPKLRVQQSDVIGDGVQA